MPAAGRKAANVSQSENQVHFIEAAFVPVFSEGNSGSSFFE
jgi:hypothetical protein